MTLNRITVIRAIASTFLTSCYGIQKAGQEIMVNFRDLP